MPRRTKKPLVIPASHPQDESIVADFLRRHGVAEQALAKTDGSTRSEADADFERHAA